MDFRTGDAAGYTSTWLQGYLPSSLAPEALVAAFGPSEGPSDKVEDEWRIRFADGLMATVYDWKGSRWHVGGTDPVVVDRVARILGVRGRRSTV